MCRSGREESMLAGTGLIILVKMPGYKERRNDYFYLLDKGS